MSKVTFEVEDLGKFLDAYNHSLIAFHKFVSSAAFGLAENDLPKNLYEKYVEKIGSTNSGKLYNYINEEYLSFKAVYDQLIEIEKVKQENGQNQSN